MLFRVTIIKLRFIEMQINHNECFDRTVRLLFIFVCLIIYMYFFSFFFLYIIKSSSSIIWLYILYNYRCRQAFFILKLVPGTFPFMLKLLYKSSRIEHVKGISSARRGGGSQLNNIYGKVLLFYCILFILFNIYQLLIL